MKKSIDFTAIVALAFFYAAFASRIGLAAVVLTGGKTYSLVYNIFFIGGNCVLALLVGIMAGLSPLRRFFAILPAPAVLVLMYRLITGTMQPAVYLVALLMLGISVLGLEVVALIRLIRCTHHQ